MKAFFKHDMGHIINSHLINQIKLVTDHYTQDGILYKVNGM